MPPPGRGGAQRHGGRRRRRDRGGQRHPDRGGERQDRLSLLAGGPGRRRHGRGVAAARGSSAWRTRASSSCWATSSPPSAPPQIGLYNRVVPGERLMAEATEVAVRLARGPSAALGVTKQALNEEAAMDLVVRHRVGGPGPGRLHAASQLPRSLRGLPRQARAEVRVGMPDTRLIRTFLEPHHAVARRAGRRLRDGRDRHRARSRRTTPPPGREARALLGLLGAGGWLQPISRPRSPRLLPDAGGAGRGVTARRRGVRPAGARHHADPAGRHAGAEGTLARARSPRGTVMTAFAMTEPEAGSDVAGIATTARREGSGYVAQRGEDADLQRRHRRSLRRLRLHRPGQGRQGDQLLPGAGGHARAPVRARRRC